MVPASILVGIVSAVGLDILTSGSGLASGKFKVKVALFPCSLTRPATEKEAMLLGKTSCKGIFGMQTLRLNTINPNHICETCFS